jgi:DNA uptake protein ComE-like DNA-binding protein
VEAETPLSKETDLTSVGKRDNPELKISAFDDTKCYVFCNDSGGQQGVDIFYALPRRNGGHILLLDQRKKDSNLITTSSLNKLVSEMLDVIPETSTTQPLILICSAQSTFGKRRVNVPRNCIIMMRHSLAVYHGPLTSCTATLMKVNPNTADVGTLSRLLGCSNKVAKALQLQAEEQAFATFRDLQHFLENKGFSLSPDVRDSLLLVDDDDDEDYYYRDTDES